MNGWASTSTYAHMFEHSVPGLPEKAAAEGLSPLDYMRRYGAFEITRGIGPIYSQPVPASELDDVAVSADGRVYTKAARPDSLNVVPVPTPDPDASGRRPVGIEVDGEILRGFPTPSGRLEFYSSTLKTWGWPEYAIPGYIKSHVHPEHLQPGEMPLIPNFRIPVQIHTRSANSKWLDENRALEPVVDPPVGRGPPWDPRDRRPRARRDAHGVLRGEGLDHRGHQAGRRGVQPPHGPLAYRQRGPAADDGPSLDRARRQWLAAPA